MTGGR